MGSAFTSVRTLSLRRRVLAAVALLLCLVAGLAGIVDHLVGDSAMQLAALEAHYCIHGPKPAGVDCSRVDPDGMAQAWHQREIGYAGAIAFGLLIAVIAAFPDPPATTVRSGGDGRGPGQLRQAGLFPWPVRPRRGRQRR